jgi:hypothetical protein
LFLRTVNTKNFQQAITLRGFPKTLNSSGWDSLASVASIIYSNLNDHGQTIFSDKNKQLVEILQNLDSCEQHQIFQIKMDIESFIAKNIHKDYRTEEYFEPVIDNENDDITLHIDALFDLTMANIFDITRIRQIQCQNCSRKQEVCHVYKHCKTNLHDHNNSDWLQQTYNSDAYQHFQLLKCANFDCDDSKIQILSDVTSLNVPLLLFMHNSNSSQYKQSSKYVVNTLIHNQTKYELHACIYYTKQHFTAKCYCSLHKCIFDYDGQRDDGTFNKASLPDRFSSDNVALAIYVCTNYLRHQKEYDTLDH